MRFLFLGVIALGVSACGGTPDYVYPHRACVEKTNLRTVTGRYGHQSEVYDCQRYELRCTEPLVMVQTEKLIVCRLPEKSAD